MDIVQLFQKSKPVVGLDIGSSAVKAIELAKSKKGYQVIGFSYETLGPDAVVDGAIMDAPVVAAAMRMTMTAGKFKPKGVATGVSGHSVIVKRIVLPAATAEEVETSIQCDAEQHIPFDISEVNLDYQDYFLLLVSKDREQVGRARYELKQVARDLAKIL